MQTTSPPLLPFLSSCTGIMLGDWRFDDKSPRSSRAVESKTDRHIYSLGAGTHVAFLLMLLTFADLRLLITSDFLPRCRLTVRDTYLSIYTLDI